MIVYIINDTYKSTTFELLFKKLKERNLPFKVLSLVPEKQTAFYLFCKKNEILIHEIHIKNWILRFILVFFYLLRNRPKLVHTHLMISGMIGGFSSWLLRTPKRVYTRHHGDQHVYYHKHALKYDKLVNFFYTDIITLSKSHYNQIIGYEKPKSKLHILPHAFDAINLMSTDVLKAKMISKYAIKPKGFNIMINSRWTELKGIQYIIPAFKKFYSLYPDSKLWLFNSKGDYYNNIKSQLDTLVVDSYKAVEFEEEIATIYSLMNVFIHVPIRKTAESFGQVYIESMGVGLPSIFTLSGIAEDICVDNKNCLVVPFEDTSAIYESLVKIKTYGSISDTLKGNSPKVLEFFSIEKHIDALLKIYNIQKLM